MTSLTSLVYQQAQAYGLPRDTMAKVFNLASGDIVASATRLALVGLVALLLKKGLTKLGHSIDEGKPTLARAHADDQLCSRVSMSEAQLVPGLALSWLPTLKYSDS
jgi:hypothetical protein